MCISQNPHIINIAIGIISNYLADWFRGIVGEKRVRLSFAVEKGQNKEVMRFDYEGDPDGLQRLPDIIREAMDE